ncbi:hypothetical protein [Cryptosporangium aurantiacum]|uniref:Uncharacterized protein n=1 Tax=Cryptosporangium aurantiacum TaxID=134849 RepID=A0A1M7RJ78_9ACTN|nr:hypothetical protein [Cryptosporangium aurantiacum]SHN46353.1 hypothetical protein SAMN05443668_11539 [Cryptosporangium aurantiacum]
MLPTLWGRIQSRIVFTLVIGGLVTLFVTPLLPLGVGFGSKYRITFTVLVTVTVIGILWELLYHFLMQWRWEKDWPTLFGLLTFLNEGLLVWALLLAGVVPGIEGLTGLQSLSYWILFILVWVAVWVFANGPMRVFSIHWRFRGGRFV